MRDLPLPQVPQEGLGWEEKEDEGCEPGWEELQPQGMQGWWPPLARHPVDVSQPLHLFNKRLCHLTHVSVILSTIKHNKRFQTQRIYNVM